MVEGLATELLCSVCDEVCKRGAQMKCCGARACRACAVLKINKNKKCWNEDCGQEDITAVNDLENDDLLRKAVEYFNKNGKMNPAHEKVLKKTKDGKGLAKKKAGKKDVEKGEKKEPVDVAERFNQSCSFGEKCKRKFCLFVHDTETLGTKMKAAELREKGSGKGEGKPCKKAENCTNEKCVFSHPPVPKPVQEKKEKKPKKEGKKGKKGEKAAKVEAKPAAKGNGKPCKFGALCTKKDTCKFDHPKINKPCRFGAGCTTKGCKFDHSPSSKALNRATMALKNGRQMGGDLRNVISNRRPMNGGMGGGMGRMGGMGGGMGGGMASMKMRMSDMAMDDDWEDMGGRNTNLAQMQKMKEELEGMMSNVMGRASGGGMGGSGMGGGYGGSSMGRSSDRMGGSMMSRDVPMSRGYGGSYGGSSGRYNF